ncbi:MAG: hypothetical protein WBD31_27565 [Rubripirellula sp.]
MTETFTNSRAYFHLQRFAIGAVWVGAFTGIAAAIWSWGVRGDAQPTLTIVSMVALATSTPVVRNLRRSARYADSV